MDEKNSSNDHVIQVCEHLGQVDAAAWNELLDLQASAQPFMRHEYLLALEESGSATAHTGWQSRFLTVHHLGRLAGACPLYLKMHSYGEYVFDWAWADAYQRHGLAYYPKLLNAVPFTPVPGTRLMARDVQTRRALLSGIEQLALQSQLSSAHLLFLDELDQEAARQAKWLMRSSVQFHWENRAPEPYLDFADFLSQMQREKRKKIQQERRRVTESGVTITRLLGREITTADWDFFYRCYQQTYHEHRSQPYLTRDFFSRVAATMPEHWLMFIATQDRLAIAASLVVIDPARKHAYGRYWGALEHIPHLHFEACYYQPLAWCIEHGYLRFEGGAQGEHKMARGLLPIQTWSAHWLAHPQFSAAVGEFLDQEGQGVHRYMDDLQERKPFKRKP